MLASLGMLIQSQADRTEEYYGDRLQVQVDLCTKNSPAPTCASGQATDEQKKSVRKALDDNPQVESVDVRSPKDNYRRAEEELGQYETGRKQLEIVEPKDFPESYYVTLEDPQEYDAVVSQVDGMDGVGEVNSLRKLLGPLFEMLSKMRWASLSASLLLIVAAVLQVSNTIRMTAYARRREIGIMRLVGASTWHIQLPFVLESLLAAVVSAAIASAGLAAFMYFVVYGYLRETLGQVTTWVRWQEAFVVMGWTTLLAVVLALVPTFIVTRKYLDV